MRDLRDDAQIKGIHIMKADRTPDQKEDDRKAETDNHKRKPL